MTNGMRNMVSSMKNSVIFIINNYLNVFIISDQFTQYEGKFSLLDNLVDLFKKLKDTVCKNKEGELV